MYSQHTLYFIATSMLAGIGPMLAKQLIAYVGSAEQLFTEPISHLEKIPNIGPILAQEIRKNNALEKAEKEIAFLQKNNVQILTYTDVDYPQRLKNCDDSPLLFYYKGKVDFNHQKMISIVGTRSATEYGKQCCTELISSLKHHNPIIVSGLAFGIDICAHKQALQSGLQTIAVLGTPLTSISPTSHINAAREIVQQGCILSECHTQTAYDNALYVKRNRIIAGLADATIVVESMTKGGALITADFANQYNRDVCAFPGNIGNKYSQGCNMLIKQNKATLIESSKDLEQLLNWDISEKLKPHEIQKQLFIELSAEEQLLHDTLLQHKELTIDQISNLIQLPMSKTSSLLLTMEFNGLVKAFPGKRFSLV
jgi:DNA processing protein